MIFFISDQNMENTDTGQPSSSKTLTNKARVSQRNLFKSQHKNLDGPISFFKENRLPFAKHIIERYLWIARADKNIK